GSCPGRRCGAGGGIASGLAGSGPSWAHPALEMAAGRGLAPRPFHLAPFLLWRLVAQHLLPEVARRSYPADDGCFLPGIFSVALRWSDRAGRVGNGMGTPTVGPAPGLGGPLESVLWRLRRWR